MGDSGVSKDWIGEVGEMINPAKGESLGGDPSDLIGDGATARPPDSVGWRGITKVIFCNLY